MVEIHAHSPCELKSERNKVCGGCVQSISQRNVFQERRRRLIPGSIPTIRKIEPGKQSSKRQHRKVSKPWSILSKLQCSIVSLMKFSICILCVYSQTSLQIVNIFSSNSLSLVLFISPRCCILVFYPFCLFQSCGALGRC